VILPAFNKIATSFDAFAEPSQYGFASTLLNEIIFALPLLREPVTNLLSAVNLQAASEGRKDNLWSDTEKVRLILPPNYSPTDALDPFSTLMSRIVMTLVEVFICVLPTHILAAAACL